MLSSFRMTFLSSALLRASSQLCLPVPRVLGTPHGMQVLLFKSTFLLAIRRCWKSILSVMSSFPFTLKKCTRNRICTIPILLEFDC